MRRQVVLAGLLVMAAATPVRAGDVCVNGACRGIPGVHGRVTAGLTGTVKVDAGLDGGAGLAPTGVQTLTVKPDNIAIYPVVNGQALGRYGYSFGSGILWIYLGPNGCRQTGDGEIFVPCHPPDEQP